MVWFISKSHLRTSEVHRGRERVASVSHRILELVSEVEYVADILKHEMSHFFRG